VLGTIRSGSGMPLPRFGRDTSAVDQRCDADILGCSIRSTSVSATNRADKLNLPTDTVIVSRLIRLAVRQQHDLAEHSAFAQHLVRAARLFEGQPLRDQRLDPALFEQVQQR
jgi:hypothetical protein